MLLPGEQLRRSGRICKTFPKPVDCAARSLQHPPVGRVRHRGLEGRMTRLVRSALAVFVLLGGIANAQNTSQVFGRVTDVSGAVMPGVTVTLSGQALLEPRIAL